ncbi:hypothetical protein EJ05DRAFT_477961 [Pseudovirgaria hyperparasitica]|uniref:Uncharacterized protein n=1 Tax=Pseudovirgaria hyperparasitica TaxID=470096 RepID=A0A6A6W1U2_9PEZI|nr:uncharacterized protein EJ05DRAFT_477961 [Pseudovirgaria hyperparasitica]KAF2755900.1 hypothetical protein EJ05DRAFT_477961 [Pseudovirgaria hyperparasitica]
MLTSTATTYVLQFTSRNLRMFVKKIAEKTWCTWYVWRGIVVAGWAVMRLIAKQ